MDRDQIYVPDRRTVNMAGAEVSVVQGKIDVAISQFAQQYRNNALVGEQVFPRVGVLKQSDFYWTFGRENQALRENDLRAPATAAERIQQTLSKQRYFCPDHSLARLIPDEERGNFMAGDLEQWATGTIMDKLLLAEEVRIAAQVANTANYAAGNFVDLSTVQTQGASPQWDSFLPANPQDSSNPINDVEVGKSVVRQIGQNPNVMVIPDPVYKVLRVHPQIVDRFKFVNGGEITLQQLATVFGVERVYPASAIQLDQAQNVSFVWGKHVFIGYCQPNPNFYDVSFGKTFVWEEAPGTVGGFSTEIARLTPASAKADELATHFYYGQAVTSNVAGYLIKNAVR
jgi:hypothetical protein